MRLLLTMLPPSAGAMPPGGRTDRHHTVRPPALVQAGIIGGVLFAVILAVILVERIPRATAIRAEVAIESHFSDAPVVLLGDSIAYGAGPASLCGQPVFNAAVPRSTVRDVLSDGPPVVARIQPKAVVVAIGVNDAVLPKESVDTWKQRYLALLAKLAPAHPILVEINPIDETYPNRNRLYDRAYMARQNVALREIATQTGAQLVPAPTHALTFDGLHPSPAGAALWRDRLSRVACH